MTIQNIFITLALVATFGLATTALAGGMGNGYGYGHGGRHMMGYGSNGGNGNCPAWSDTATSENSGRAWNRSGYRMGNGNGYGYSTGTGQTTAVPTSDR